jgi:glyoxylase-like metal-dependent hydrolase (beta-lactamase superfamily II)
MVDAGVPTSWRSFQDALWRLGRRAEDVDALVLTHAHFDHIGFAERARAELWIPVNVHEDDVPLTGLPRRYAFERRPLRHVARHVGVGRRLVVVDAVL